MQTMLLPTRRLLLAILIAVIPLVPGAGAETPHRDTILIGKKKVPYLSNFSLALTNANVTRAIIVIHGGLRILDPAFT